MKQIITIFLVLITSITTFAQNFEGKIYYENNYVSKNAQMTSEQWTSMMGSKQEYVIKQGSYKNISNGTMALWQLYINKENKLYTKLTSSETIFWNDASIQGDEVLKSVINKNAVDILGYKCDELILTCKSGIQKYYFNNKLGVDIKLFTNHKFGNWYDFLSKSNSLPLKMIIETEQFTMESTAKEIKPMVIDEKTFILPIGSKTEKSPY